MSTVYPINIYGENFLAKIGPILFDKMLMHDDRQKHITIAHLSILR